MVTWTQIISLGLAGRQPVQKRPDNGSTQVIEEPVLVVELVENPILTEVEPLKQAPLLLRPDEVNRFRALTNIRQSEELLRLQQARQGAVKDLIDIIQNENPTISDIVSWLPDRDTPFINNLKNGTKPSSVMIHSSPPEPNDDIILEVDCREAVSIKPEITNLEDALLQTEFPKDVDHLLDASIKAAISKYTDIQHRQFNDGGIPKNGYLYSDPFDNSRVNINETDFNILRKHLVEFRRQLAEIKAEANLL